MCEDWCIDSVWRQVHWLCVKTGALIVWTLVHWLCVNTGALIVSGKGTAWAGESTAEGWVGQGQWPSPSHAGKMSRNSGPSVRTDWSTGPCRANLSALHTTPGYNCCQFHCCDTIQSRVSLWLSSGLNKIIFFHLNHKFNNDHNKIAPCGMIFFKLNWIEK